MNVQQQIKSYIASHPEPKRGELQHLHDSILKIFPECTLWFLDGKDNTGKIVTNPSIGYGNYTMKRAGGIAREFYRIGLSSNRSGISVYIMGLEDKKYLAETYGKTLGKATITGYCIRFKSISNIDLEVLESAIRFRLLRAT